MNEIKVYGLLPKKYKADSRVYDTGGVSPTLLAKRCDKEMIAVKQNTKLGYEKVGEGGCFNMAYPQSRTRRGRVIDGGNIAPTMDTTNTTAVLEKESPIRVRRLTPRECFRLQGWTDDYFDKAALVNSDSQLYKQAGNGVTVDVIYAIAKEME